MKKIGLFLFLLVALVGITSCSKERRAEDVAEKITQGASLTQGDYTAMIEYLGDYATKAQVYQDTINDLPVNDPAVAEATEKLSNLTAEYKYLSLFNTTLSSTTPAEVGKDNVALVNKYASLIWFTAPSWAEINNAPGDTAGDVVDMPDDSGTVIANSEAM